MARKRRARRSWLSRILWSLVILTFVGLAGAAAAGYFIYQDLLRDLPDISHIGDYKPLQVTRVYASDGTLIDEWTDENRIFRTVLSYDEIPQVMRDAILAAEDSSFYEHPGLDLRGLIRAAIANFRAGGVRQGASTITQQVVKNLVLSPERTYRRKAQELLLAYKLEQNLSKDDILTLYLNEVFFGRMAYGIEEASRYYFAKGAGELELHEAALLAGLVQSPNRYNPYNHEERALARRGYVLRQMYEKGMIVESLYREADERPIQLAEEPDLSARRDARWYVLAAWRELEARSEELLGMSPTELRTSGLEVHLAVDLEAQRAAQWALQDGLRAVDDRRGFLRPFRQLRSEDEAQQWRRDNHQDVRQRGITAGESYRAVIIRSDDEATLVGIGPWVLNLNRVPHSRHCPGEPCEWSRSLPLNAVFTVESDHSYTPEELSSDEPNAAVVHLRTPPEGAIIAMSPSSRSVLALVGGYDLSLSTFNRAVQARRQTGSVFKPFVFGAAIQERVITPATVYIDQPFTEAMVGSDDWRPSNHDGRFMGPMSARLALARSRNTITAQILRRVGVSVTQDWARRVGISSDLPDGLSLALGAAEMSPLELTNAYATFAAEGVYGEPILIGAITDRHGDTLYSADAQLEQRLDPEVAWMVTSMLRSVVTEGTGGRARSLGVDVVGKTGTTNGLRDAWFAGYMPGLVVGVWVGRDDFTPIGRGEGGSATALPIWISVIDALKSRYESEAFPEPPAGVEQLLIDPESGLRANPGREGARTEFFLRGSAPLTFAPESSERQVRDVLLGGEESSQDEERRPATIEESFDGSF